MDASALRWTLAIIGIVLLLGIYLYGLHQNRLRRRAARETFTREEIDSAFIEDEQLREELDHLGRLINADDKVDLAAIHINPAMEADLQPAIVARAELFIPDAVAEIAEGNLVSHLLMHEDHRLMTGEEVSSALEFTGMEAGSGGLMRFRREDGLGFSVGSLSAPGHFGEVDQLEFTTLGLNCFFDLGDSADAFGNYELMLKKIDELVRIMNVKVYQPDQRLLTISDVTHIRRRLSAGPRSD